MENITQFIFDEAKKIYGDEKKAEEFVNGFITKSAATFGDYFKTPTGPMDTRAATFPSSLAKGMGEQAGRALASGIAALGISGLGSLLGEVKGHRLYNLFLRALNEAIQTNRVLKAADKQKVINFAHTIFRFAPHIATDTNLLSSILSNAIHGDSIDPMTIRTLTELESRYKDTTDFDPKRWM